MTLHYSDTAFSFMPCLFQGNWIPGVQFPYFSIFENHLKSQSKESEFRSTNKLLLPAGKCFPFLVKRKTLSFMDKTHLPLSSSLYPKIVERIITKKTLILFICCLFRRKKFLCICICCANNPSLLGKLPLIFFPYPVWFFISSSHSNNLTKKPNQIYHKQASH